VSVSVKVFASEAKVKQIAMMMVATMAPMIATQNQPERRGGGGYGAA